jgi:L-ascorbate metabolism protein UlaG (beta-lactamase superfamily)
MLIQKFFHSCLLFSKDGTKVLFDPGRFSFLEGRMTPDAFADVEHIVITHTHPDHLDIEALKAIVELSDASIVGNAEVGGKLLAEGLALSRQVGDGDCFALGSIELAAITVKHEEILDETLPEVTAFLLDGRVLHPVDSFDNRLLVHAGAELVILPVMAPFLTETRAFAFGKALRPKAILPVHEGYALDFFIKARHQTYARFFRKEGIAFHSLVEPGASIEI